MNTELMNAFVKYMEKQEILSKLTEDENYTDIIIRRFIQSLLLEI